MFQFTVTTTTPPVTVLCSRAIAITVTLTPVAVDLAVSGQPEVVLPPQLLPGDTIRGYAGLTTVLLQQQSQFQMPSEACANYSLGPFQVIFSLRVEPPTHSFVIYLCLLWCLLSAFRFPCG